MIDLLILKSTSFNIKVVEDYLFFWQKYFNLKILSIRDTYKFKFKNKNIILIHHLLNIQKSELIFLHNNNNLFIFNTEQNTNNFNKLKINDYLNLDLKIIDYSLVNKKILNNHKNIIYVPYQYSDEFSNFKNIKKEYEYGFVGIITPYREKILKEFDKSKINIIKNKFGIERDKEISKCNYILNIHANENFKIFEHIRCDRLIFAGIKVVSEYNLNSDLLDIKDFIIDIENINNINYNQENLTKIIENRKKIFDDFLLLFKNRN